MLVTQCMVQVSHLEMIRFITIIYVFIYVNTYKCMTDMLRTLTKIDLHKNEVTKSQK
jgi:hypothetical protein